MKPVKSLEFYGVTISPDHYPDCMGHNPYSCSACKFFPSDKCPLLLDHQNFELSRRGFLRYQEAVYLCRGSDELFDAAQTELLGHGRPLHYQLLAKIINDRYPQLSVSNNQVYLICKNNPVFFQETKKGVFQVIERRKRSNTIEFLLEDIDES